MIFFYFFKEKNMFKSHYIKSDHRVLWKKLSRYLWSTSFCTWLYSATGLAAKMWTNPNEHSVYTRFLCPRVINYATREHLQHRHHTGQLSFDDSNMFIEQAKSKSRKHNISVNEDQLWMLQMFQIIQFKISKIVWLILMW